VLPAFKAVSAFLTPTAVNQLVKEYERGDMPRVEWQDSLAFRQIEKIHAVGFDAPPQKNPC
jgi:hypothetical protein